MSSTPQNYRFNSNAIALLCAKASYAGLSFLQFAVLVRYLDRDAINILVVALAVQNLMAIGADFGVSYVASKNAAGRDREVCSIVLAAGCIALSVFNVVAWLVAAAIIGFLYESPTLILAASLGCLLGTLRTVNDLIDSLMIAQGRSAIVAGQSCVQYGLSLVGAWAIVAIGDGSVLSVLLYTAVIASLTIVIRLAIMQPVWSVAGNLTAIRTELSIFLRSCPAFGMHALIVALSSANVYTLVISQVATANSYLADFQGAHKITALAGLAGGVVARTLYVAVCHAMAVDDERLLARYLEEAIRVLTILAVVVTIPCVMLREQLVHFLYGDKLPVADDLLLIMGIGLPFSFVGYIPSNLLAARGRHWLRLVVSIVFGLAACPIAWVCTEYWGIRGTAFALSAMTAASALTFFVVEHQTLRTPLPLQSTWRILAAAAAATVFTGLIRGIENPLMVLIGAEAAFVATLLLVDETHRRQCRSLYERLLQRGVVR